MIQDLSPDVKKFLLSYTSINQLTEIAKSELNWINGLLEAEVAKQEWFSSIEFQTQISSKWLQVWKKNWHPSVTHRCPWIHFEYTLSWPDQWVQASVDIESLKIATKEAVQNVADWLHQFFLTEKPALLKSEGWILRSKLEAKRMLLVKRHNIDVNNFSAEWILSTGKELLNELSEVIPYIDQSVEKLFCK